MNNKDKEAFEKWFKTSYLQDDLDWFVNEVYSSLLKNQKIVLKAGDSLDSVINLSENDMKEIVIPKDFKFSPEKLKEALKEVE